MDRPLCKCHGEPMTRSSRQANGRQKWACALKRRGYSKARYWTGGRKEQMAEIRRERIRTGLCARCGEPRLSESLCWDCLNELEARGALR